MSQQIDLKTAFENYLKAEREYSEAQALTHELIEKEPIKPKSATLEEARQLAQEIQDWEAEQKKSLALTRSAFSVWCRARADLLTAIPLPNIWIRVGDYAVGKFYDVWGGGHYEIAVRDWQDDLPELKDQTYYP